MAKPTKKKSILPKKPRKGQTKLEKKVQKSAQGTNVDFNWSEEVRTPSTAVPEALRARANPNVLNRLWTIIDSRRGADPELSHSARLLSKGAQRVAQKFGEEVIECIVELSTGNRRGVISESADVLYHLLVAWVSAGIMPEEVWRELEQREKVSYLSEGQDVALKRLLGSVRVGTTKIP